MPWPHHIFVSRRRDTATSLPTPRVAPAHRASQVPDRASASAPRPAAARSRVAWLVALAVGFAGLAGSAPAQAQPIPLDDGSVYWPAAGMYQPVMGELWQHTAATCDGERCATGMDVDDPDALAIAHANETAAATSTAAPGVQIDPVPGQVPSNQPYRQTFHKDEDFGHGTFGAGYTLDGAVRADPVTPLGGGSGVSIFATGDATTYARVFNNTATLAVAQLRLASRPEAGASTFGLFFLGAQVYAGAVFPGQSRDEKLFSRAFVKYSKQIPILGFDVTVEAAVSGNAGATYEGTFNAAGARVTFTPQAGIYATASASVGLDVILVAVKVGVEGSLTLVSFKAPIFLKLGAVSCSELEALLGSDLEINTLAGRIAAFVKVRFLFIKKKKFFTLAKFSGTTRGFTGAINLGTAGTRQPFYLTCTPALTSAIAALAAPLAPLPPPPPPPPSSPPPPWSCPHCQEP
jgi:hypothetical protein